MADDIYTIQFKLETEAAKRAVTELGAKVNEVKGKADSVRVTSFDGIVSGTKSAAAGISSMLAVLGPLAAGFASVTAVTNLFWKSLDRADGLNKFSDQISSTVENLQDYQFQLTRIGLSSEAADKVIYKMAAGFEALKTGTGNAAESFARIGITATDIDLNNFDKSLALVRSQIHLLGKESIDTKRFISDMLGEKYAVKAGAFLTNDNPLIDSNKITSDAAEAADKLKDAFDDFQRSLGNSMVNLMMEPNGPIQTMIRVLKEARDFYNTDAPAESMRPGYKGYNPETDSTDSHNSFGARRASVNSDVESVLREIGRGLGIGEPSEDERKYWEKRAAEEEKAIHDAPNLPSNLAAADKLKSDKAAAALAKELAMKEQLKAMDAKIAEAQNKANNEELSAVEILLNERDRLLAKKKELLALEQQLAIIKTEGELTDFFGSIDAKSTTMVPTDQSLVLERNKTSEFDLQKKIKEKTLEIANQQYAVNKADKALTQENTQLLKAEEMETARKLREAEHARRQRMSDMAAFGSIFEGLPSMENSLNEMNRDLTIEKFEELANRLGVDFGLAKIALAQIKKDFEDLSTKDPLELVKIASDSSESDTRRGNADSALQKQLKSGNMSAGKAFGVGALSAVNEFGTMAENMAEIGRDLINNLTTGFTSFFTSIIDGSKSAGEAFKDLAQSIISQLLSMLTQALIVKPILESVVKMATGDNSGTKSGFGWGGGYMNTFHSGGSADNVQVVAKRGEVVVPQQDMRKQSSGDGVTIINVQESNFAEMCAKNPDAIVNAMSSRRKQVKNILANAA